MFAKILPNSYPDMYQLGCHFVLQYVDEMKKSCLQDPHSTRKMVCQVNENHRVTQRTLNLVMESLIGCILAKLFLKKEF